MPWAGFVKPYKHMKNHVIELLKRELETLKMFKDGYENQQRKRTGEELLFVEEQLINTNEKILIVEKSLETLTNV